MQNLCVYSFYQGAAATFIHYLGFTPGLSIIGPCGILIMWIYGYFWLIAMLLIAGGMQRDSPI